VRRENVQRLYDEHGAGLLAYACSMLGDRSTAEDVLHQVFLRLLAGNVAIPNAPRAYLYRAVRNTALNVCRSASRRVELNLDQAWFEAPPGILDEGLELQGALYELPGEQREVIMLRIWGGMTLEEAAAVLGIPPNTAASRYRYGLAKLRERMGPRAGE
jgi:RNA polymerase sigma-70 factor (ECF subfamily)